MNTDIQIIRQNADRTIFWVEPGSETAKKIGGGYHFVRNDA